MITCVIIMIAIIRFIIIIRIISGTGIVNLIINTVIIIVISIIHSMVFTKRVT